MTEFYAGLMSGTSMDGIDVALVDFSKQPTLIAASYTEYPAELRQKILALTLSPHINLRQLGELDVILGKQFAQAINYLFTTHKIPKKTVCAIGSHGQTIFHAPHGDLPFTMQIGDPNIITAETGLTTIADFRRKDIAYGGQGAPLVPAFHAALFHTAQKNRAVVNVGGIANITVLAANQRLPIIGFDTGPGNTLLDSWIMKHHQQLYDAHGAWGAQGVIQSSLLEQLLKDPYFNRKPPKSTGREYFNLEWLSSFLPAKYSPVDIQTTLVELTARSIVTAIQNHLAEGEILISGGGVHNNFLMKRLQILGTNYDWTSTQTYQINPNFIEAMAFAWLARQTIMQQPGNIPEVTGASTKTVLGAVYYS